MEERDPDGWIPATDDNGAQFYWHSCSRRSVWTLPSRPLRRFLGPRGRGRRGKGGRCGHCSTALLYFSPPRRLCFENWMSQRVCVTVWCLRSTGTAAFYSVFSALPGSTVVPWCVTQRWLLDVFPTFHVNGTALGIWQPCSVSACPLGVQNFWICLGDDFVNSAQCLVLRSF